MNICLIAPIPPFRGGIAKYCYSLAQELEKRHNLLLLSYHRQYPAFLFGNRLQFDSTTDCGAVSGQFRNLSYELDSLGISSWYTAARKVTAFSADLVILPWWVTYWTPQYLWLLRYFRKRGIRCLLLCINVYDHDGGGVRNYLTRAVLGRGEMMIVHSEDERRELHCINGTAVIRSHLLPLFRYEPSQATDRTQTLNLLFFGFVRPYKGLDLLLKAMGLVKDLNLKLKVVGEFWHGTGEYLELIRQLDIADSVEMIDCYVSDSDMSNFFAESDVVVLPYRTSKTSGVIATSYGYGKPVLATDVGGFHEVVKDRLTGRLIPPLSVPDLVDGIRWFYGNRETDFAGNISSFVEEQMSWGSLVDMIEEMCAT